MILTMFHGFSMALADSVPGVSGGTVAFILGFYERFIDALHALVRGTGTERKDALRYLLRLGIGWAAGMAACVVVLSSLFAKHIYFMSSLFLGLTLASIPFIVREEWSVLRGRAKNAPFALLGAAVVVGLTLLRGGAGTLGSVNYSALQPLQYLYLFASGAVAICAMVLPGISGSSILLIAGVYLPTVQAARSLLHLDFAVLPGLIALGLGILAGIALSICAIRAALKKYRSQMVYLILGLMAGSLYAIVCGPASIDPPAPPLDFGSFRIAAFVLGCAVLLALELLRRATERRRPDAPQRPASAAS